MKHSLCSDPSRVQLSGENLLSLSDLRANDVSFLIDLAYELKQSRAVPDRSLPLSGKTLGMIFDKSSTRTRVSFEVAMNQLGGHVIFLNKSDIQLGRGESIRDTAKVLSRFIDGLMIRTSSHDDVVELARIASVPVINGLTDLCHPCQILADLLTIFENKGKLPGVKVAYLGDGNNVVHSLLLGAALTGMHISVATPSASRPKATVVQRAKRIAEQSKSTISIGSNVRHAITNADVIYTDAWTSMGQEQSKRNGISSYAPFQVCRRVMEQANPNAIFMHCLPAHRGEEVTDEVMDGAQSVVFDQAENRLHAQKAVLTALLG